MCACLVTEVAMGFSAGILLSVCRASTWFRSRAANISGCFDPCQHPGCFFISRDLLRLIPTRFHIVLRYRPIDTRLPLSSIDGSGPSLRDNTPVSRARRGYRRPEPGRNGLRSDRPSWGRSGRARQVGCSVIGVQQFLPRRSALKKKRPGTLGSPGHSKIPALARRQTLR